MKRTAILHTLMAAAALAAAAQINTPYSAEDAAWQRARAEVNINADNASRMLSDFISDYAASLHRHEARMLLGDCLLEESPAEAYRQYSLVDEATLSPDHAAALRYHKAYAAMKLGQLDEAEKLFTASARDPKWRALSDFYLGYIAYTRHDYAQAKAKLENADRRHLPGSMADYYLAQIYYVEGDYAKALASARDLLKRDVEAQYTAEANRIAGESLFQQGKPSQALPYLRTYAETATAPERSTLYILGTTEFKEGNFEKAMQYLEPVTAKADDAMAQSAYLFMGQALMELGDKDAALLAFDKALKMDYDPETKEAAYYNYAVARVGGAKMPFGSSSAIFEDFLQRYPTGRYTQAVQDYLVSGYLTDGNYEQALASIRRMKNPGHKVLTAKQQVLYALGTRALAANNAPQAVEYLREAQSLDNQNAATATQVALSLGEALYKTGDYDSAVPQLNKYLKSASPNDINHSLGRYDLGYARFAQKDYKNAAINFQKVIDRPGKLPKEAIVDAYNRLADTKFYTNDFADATRLYKKAFEMAPASGDYPLFQQAVIQGYQRENKAKIATINQLLRDFPSSSLIPDALLEMTEGYIQLGDNASAIDTYNRLVNDYPTTEQGRRGYLQMALTQLNTGDREGALDSYREVVRLYPSSDEARMAMDELKRISADEGTLGQLRSWLATVDNAPQLDVAETDELSFNAAEKAWLTNGNAKRLETYLIDFPQGANRAVALGYLMENARENGSTGDALTFATEIVEKYPDSRLAENALAVKAAAEHELGRGGDALRTWTALESRASNPQNLNAARTGIMRVARDLNDHERVIAAADALLASSTLGSEDRTEAQFSRALALDQTGDTKAAREAWTQLAENTDDLYGAKSSYYLAQSLMDSGETESARREVEKLIDSGTPHTYWLARGFILLSDIFAKQGKNFEAREYLNSLRENYPGNESDIFQMIEQRLSDLK